MFDPDLCTGCPDVLVLGVGPDVKTCQAVRNLAVRHLFVILSLVPTECPVQCLWALTHWN